MQQFLDIGGEALLFDGDIAGKERLGQDLEGEFRHVHGDIGDEGFR